MGDASSMMMLVSAILAALQETPEPAYRLRAGDRPVLSVSFDRDGRRLLTAGSPVRLWDVASGRELCALEDTASRTWTMRFSADGKTIAGFLEEGTEAAI